jgi:hypothetical protein
MLMCFGVTSPLNYVIHDVSQPAVIVAEDIIPLGFIMSQVALYK